MKKKFRFILIPLLVVILSCSLFGCTSDPIIQITPPASTEITATINGEIAKYHLSADSSVGEISHDTYLEMQEIVQVIKQGKNEIEISFSSPVDLRESTYSLIAVRSDSDDTEEYSDCITQTNYENETLKVSFELYEQVSQDRILILKITTIDLVPWWPNLEGVGTLMLAMRFL